MANKQAASADELFGLLDKEMDDIADLPSFKCPPTGIYGLRFQLEVKEINDKPAVIAKLEIREVQDLADSDVDEKDMPKVGDKFDIAHILKDDKGADSEIGWGRLKELCMPFQEHVGETNLRKIVQKLTTDPVDITAKIKKVARKNDKEVFDARISDITVD